MNANRPDIAVLMPCFNEASTVAATVRAFREAIPDCVVHVYDNGSEDETVAEAQEAGAVCRDEPRRGKGNVVRRMFADVEADIYIMVDGDHTYDASAAPEMVERLLRDNLDMVVGIRREAAVAGETSAFPPGHRFGNRLIGATISRLFGPDCTDVLSGYRVLSRRFVKSFPVISTGFEIETELTVHCLDLGLPMAEVETRYRARIEGSRSKLNRFPDGFRILATILRLLKEMRPRLFFATLALIMAAISVILALPLLWTYLETGLVPRFPTAILATGIMLLAFLCLACGLILDGVRNGRREAKLLAYLALPSPSSATDS